MRGSKSFIIIIYYIYQLSSDLWFLSRTITTDSQIFGSRVPTVFDPYKIRIIRYTQISLSCCTVNTWGYGTTCFFDPLCLSSKIYY